MMRLGLLIGVIVSERSRGHVLCSNGVAGAHSGAYFCCDGRCAVCATQGCASQSSGAFGGNLRAAFHECCVSRDNVRARRASLGLNETCRDWQDRRCILGPRAPPLDAPIGETPLLSPNALSAKTGLSTLPDFAIEYVHPSKTGGGTVESFLAPCRRFVGQSQRVHTGSSHHFDTLYKGFQGETSKFNVSLAVISLRDPAERAISHWMMVHGAITNTTMSRVGSSRSWTIADAKKLISTANLRVNGRFKGLFHYHTHYFPGIAVRNDSRIVALCTETLTEDLIQLRDAACPELAGRADEQALKNKTVKAKAYSKMHIARASGSQYNISQELRQAIYRAFPLDRDLHQYYCECRPDAPATSLSKDAGAYGECPPWRWSPNWGWWSPLALAARPAASL